MTEHTKEPVAYRLTNTAYRKPRFEYFATKEEAERRQFDFNRSVDDGGLYDLTPLYGSGYIEQLERESSACDMVAELIKQRDAALAEMREIHQAINGNQEESTIDEVRRIVAALKRIASGEAENGSILSGGECQSIAHAAIASAKGGAA